MWTTQFTDKNLISFYRFFCLKKDCELFNFDPDLDVIRLRSGSNRDFDRDPLWDSNWNPDLGWMITWIRAPPLIGIQFRIRITRYFGSWSIESHLLPGIWIRIEIDWIRIRPLTDPVKICLGWFFFKPDSTETPGLGQIRNRNTGTFKVGTNGCDYAWFMHNTFAPTNSLLINAYMVWRYANMLNRVAGRSCSLCFLLR